MSVSVASDSVPVGSSVFFALALLTICVLALALPASVVLLVPIDLASSSRDDGSGPRAIWLPDRLVLVSWRIAYWLIFVLTWWVSPGRGEGAMQ